MFFKLAQSAAANDSWAHAPGADFKLVARTSLYASPSSELRTGNAIKLWLRIFSLWSIYSLSSSDLDMNI